ncbi:hypothetical protein BC829DRAFT_27242 [Chytridium lagenaria]|nr:hypothetical protein BC829DRAFT_27242 [Chytridium lagenaria]
MSNTPQSRFPPDEMTTGRCQCCDTLLLLRRGTTCFRCTVCDTVNDLEPIPPPGILFRSIEFGQIKSAPTFPTSPTPPRPLDVAENVIRDSFCYHHSLNESFFDIDTGTNVDAEQYRCFVGKCSRSISSDHSIAS